ncbi:unnamed protein product (macronuclear) [Paramecium tetraurelia]|uniref:Uncharacterized protein n=1 Tax=Paramecium tetraurelia TaxID=5888 RepID=A0CZ50_PARTE|nr:uncharacterized protein GSPATT00039107001 [Paramecium tetraurelia]CAK76067.1 unnamed protein product [Paramecium tetraurelia]|eukprot:XP_001443464.1 hypothetical protein (macronuclear) [Paramecium tetraurelia strain d4-2]
MLQTKMLISIGCGEHVKVFETQEVGNRLYNQIIENQANHIKIQLTIQILTKLELQKQIEIYMSYINGQQIVESQFFLKFLYIIGQRSLENLPFFYEIIGNNNYLLNWFRPLVTLLSFLFGQSQNSIIFLSFEYQSHLPMSIQRPPPFMWQDIKSFSCAQSTLFKSKSFYFVTSLLKSVNSNYFLEIKQNNHQSSILFIYNIQKIQFTKKGFLLIILCRVTKDIKKCLISEQHDSFDILMQNNQVSYIFNFDLYTKSFPNIQVQLPFVPQEKISLYSHIYVYVLIIRLRIKEFRTYVLLNNIKQFNFIIENRIQNLLLKIVIPDNIVISQKKRIIFFEFIGIKRLC